MFTLLVLAVAAAALYALWYFFGKPATAAQALADLELELKSAAGVSKPAPAETIVQPAVKPAADVKPGA